MFHHICFQLFFDVLCSFVQNLLSAIVKRLLEQSAPPLLPPLLLNWSKSQVHPPLHLEQLLEQLVNVLSTFCRCLDILAIPHPLQSFSRLQVNMALTSVDLKSLTGPIRHLPPGSSFLALVAGQHYRQSVQRSFHLFWRQSRSLEHTRNDK